MTEQVTSNSRLAVLRARFDERNNPARALSSEWKTAHTEELMRIAESLQRQVDALSTHASKWVTRALELQQRAVPEPPAAPIFPIARLTVGEDDTVTATMYAPGLPPGQHDLFPVPLNPNGHLAPSMFAEPLCPHGMPLAENICGPCSQGRPNRAPVPPPAAPSGITGYDCDQCFEAHQILSLKGIGDAALCDRIEMALQVKESTAEPPTVNHDETVLMLQDAEDAKRYRWLRDHCEFTESAALISTDLSSDKWDAAIDEAMRSAETKSAYGLERLLEPESNNPVEVLPDGSVRAPAETNVTLSCDGCDAKAELPRVGKENDFVSIIPANGWQLYPRHLCPKCSVSEPDAH